MKILLIQLRRIGDLILTTPAIAALRQSLPEAEISLVTSRACEPLLPAVAGISRSFVIRRSPADLAVLSALFRTAFDCSIDFTRNNRSALLTAVAHAKKRVGSYRLKRRSLLRRKIYTDFVQNRIRDLHTIDYNLSLLAPLGVHTSGGSPHLQIPPTAEARAKQLRQQWQIAESFVVFHPGSARVEKFWETDRWAELIGAVVERWGMTAVLTGGDSPQEKGHLAAIEALLPRPVDQARPSIVDLCGKMDLLTLAALIQQARLLVTVDSAPMHLASALGTPQVVLFGPTNPFHWQPRHGPVSILYGGSPVPVREFVSKAPRLPMKLISTEAVIGAMNSLLSIPTH